MHFPFNLVNKKLNSELHLHFAELPIKMTDRLWAGSHAGANSLSMPHYYMPRTYGRKRAIGMVSGPVAARPVARSAWFSARRSAVGYGRTGGYFGRYNRGGAYSRLRGNRFVRRRDIEKKFIDTVYTDAATSTWGVSTSANLIAQGTTESTRVGRKVIITDIHVRSTWTYAPEEDGSTANNPTKVRWLMVWDKQCNGANATNTDVVESSSQVNCFNNLANKGRFVILFDKEFILKPMAAAGTGVANDWGGDKVDCDFHKKVRIPIEFDSTTGSITEIRSNNLFFMRIRDTTESAVTQVTNVRLRFTDM